MAVVTAISSYQEGALSIDYQYGLNTSVGSGNDVGANYVNFNARNSNNIYKDINVVQPPTLTINYVIKY